MAFQFKRVEFYPPTLESTYVIPCSWINKGLSLGELSLDLPRFGSSLQGSVYLAVEDLIRQGELQRTDDLFAFYHTKGVVELFSTKDQVFAIESDRIKTGFVYLLSLSTMKQVSYNQQKTINNGLIQCLPGCGVTMHHSLWEL